MSIYPVKLSNWFPPSDENWEIASSLVKVMCCVACGSKARWKAAWGHHSLPWGYGDLWCSKKCLISGNTHVPDKRQKRKLKRLLKQHKNEEVLTINLK